VPMNSLKRILLSAVPLIVLLPTCGAQTTPRPSGAPLTDEQLSVYGGLLDKLSALHIKNLSNSTSPFDFDGFPDGRPCLSGIELEDPSDATKTTHGFGPKITKGRNLNLVDADQQTKLIKQRDAAQNGSDLRFLVLSETVFDTKHQFAVVKYRHVCGERCVVGATLVMEKIDGRWTASARRPCAMFAN
jgi:hypothetical protein